jgi:hypothetical protein
VKIVLAEPLGKGDKDVMLPFYQIRRMIITQQVGFGAETRVITQQVGLVEENPGHNTTSWMRKRNTGHDTTG